MRFDSSAFSYAATPTALSPSSICTATTLTPKELSSTTTTYRTQKYTVVTLPTTVSIPSGLNVTFELLKPTQYQTTLTPNSTHVVFNISHEYDLKQEFELQYKAKVNNTLFTINTYTVTVGCREECKYCQNDNECIHCAVGHESFCEHYSDFNKILIKALAGVIKALVLLLAFRSIIRLKIDHAFWLLINMIQVLRLMTLMETKVGLVLRDFLNDELKGFMIQININLLPKLLFSGDTTISRQYTLFGIHSYIFMYYFLTSIGVIIAVAFALTFVLAILECLKKTKRRLKLMIAIATYLSLNLWIRGIYELSLTLFIVCILDIKYTFIGSFDIIEIVSKICFLTFCGVVFLMVALMIRYFIKRKDHEKWPKGILEMYEPLRPTAMCVITYNLLFLIKRFAFAVNITMLGFLGANPQLLINCILIITGLVVSAILVRFKSIVTTVIYYFTEMICLVCFGLMFLYDNQSSVDDVFDISMSDFKIDRIIIIFIACSVGAIMILVTFEGVLAGTRLIKAHREKSKTGARAPKGSKQYVVDEEIKYDRQRPDFKSDIDAGFEGPEGEGEGLEIEDFDAIKEEQKIGESMISRNTISQIMETDNKPVSKYEDIMISNNNTKSKDLEDIDKELPNLSSTVLKLSGRRDTTTSGFGSTKYEETKGQF